jgi:hypothetical protein
MKNNIVIICTPLTFFTQNDEDLLFGWFKKIKCIKKFEGVGRELHLYITSKKISNNDLLDLMGIFERYKFENPDQLKIFMNKNNREWFEDEKTNNLTL